MSWTFLTDRLERVIQAIEHATALDPPSDRLQQLTSRLPDGAVKDVLSGSPLGHPLHPFAVTVPLGAFVSASTLDLLSADRRAARSLIGLGLLASLPAAVAGLSDWNDTDGAERRVGLVHAVSNVAGLALLARSWSLRSTDGAGRVTSTLGLGLLGVGGWLGGHLTYALGVGVDTTAFLRPPTDWADTVEESALVDGRPTCVDVGGTPVLLVRSAGELYALNDRCTHRGAPLHEGDVRDGCVTCPWHGSEFDLSTGAVARGPATRPATVLEVRVVNGVVQVRRAEARALRLNPVGA